MDVTFLRGVCRQFGWNYPKKWPLEDPCTLFAATETRCIYKAAVPVIREDLWFKFSTPQQTLPI